MSGDPVTVSDLSVSGGAGGTSADLDDLRVLAATSQDLADQLADVSLAAHGLLLDADWVASAVLCPSTAAAAAGVLVDALDGGSGLTWLAGRLAFQSTAVTLAADAYEAADAAQAAAMDVWEWFEGASGFWFVEALVAARNGLLSGDFELWLTEHPEVVDDLVNSAPGLLAGTPLLWPGVLGAGEPFAFVDKQAAVRAVGFYLPDGPATVVPLDDDDVRLRSDRGLAVVPPTGVGGLMDMLQHRNHQATGASDIIDVQTITQPDGTVAFIVDIPGTKGGVNLLEPGDKRNDWNTNLHVLAGETTQRELAIAEAVRQAMKDAGVGPDAPVMLVGHSQGGMVAAQAAADSEALGLNITHVVTAGSPIALADVPPDVQVLSLENSHDIVPHFDGESNPGSANHTTVTFDDQDGSIGANHSLDHGYAEAADAIDESDDPSLVAFRDSAGAFLGAGPGARADVQAYEINPTP